MAGLRNTIQTFDPSSSGGIVPVGDAYSHTDPALAHGLSFALIHAAELVSALRDRRDTQDARTAYWTATSLALKERFDFATELGEQRHRMWMGGLVDFARRDGDYALFSLVAAGGAALFDPDVFRVFVRRIGLLDSTEVLDKDIEMQRRIEMVFRQLLTSPRPPAGPPRDEMLATVDAAARQE